LREELADRRSRLASLEEIQRHHEGFDRGGRAVMLRAGAGARGPGIFGLVADGGPTFARLQPAGVAAPRWRPHARLVGRRAVGVELSGYLASVAEGRSSSLPLPEAVGAAPGPLPEGLPGLVARAADEVRTEALFRPVVELLLGGVVIAEDLEAALRI